MISFALLVLAFGVCGLRAKAASDSADAPHVHVQLLAPGDTLASGAMGTRAGLYFKMEPGWHVYWMNPGDAGERPEVHWTLPKGISATALEFPAPKRLPLGPLMDFGYENQVLFPFKFQVSDAAKAGPAVLHAHVSWLVCRATCIPGKAELEITRSVTPGASSAVQALPAVFGEFLSRIPKVLPSGDKATFEATATGFRLAVETGHRETEASFFPADTNLMDNPAPQLMAATAHGLVLELKKDASLTSAPATLKGVLELAGGRAFEIAAKPGTVAAVAGAASHPAQSAESASAGGAESVGVAGMEQVASPASTGAFAGLLRIAGLAFLGGLLLNLMPCVFPVLFLKGLALVRSGNEERARLRAHGFVYAAGIVASFWVLVAVLLGLRQAGAVLGWGFQFQSPLFLELMAGLLFFLGLSLAGQFEIGLTLTSAGGDLAAKQGLTGSFFTGVLAVVVATPCTAPFMGAAVGYALAKPAAVTFAVFTALALGLAAPYVALTLQPAWTRWLPRPGAWMEVLKQAVSVPIFGTAIWLAWVLAGGYGAGLLAMLLVGFLVLAMAGWFLGRWPARRWAMVVAVLLVAGVIGLNVWAAQAMVEAVPDMTSQDAAALGSLPAMRGAAAGVVWQPWSEAEVSQAVAAGQPVFVDFTAKWCLSCQVNERVALQRPEVKQAFAAHHVRLLKADWTRHDEAITQALTALGRDGVPAYALYVPGESKPRLLPEVLTPGVVTDALAGLPGGTAAAGSQ
ncbi:MAG TPA: thioredoxin family protein [Terracidiphilus sp.]|nr:thioredoxin family protein [Terracidiphilus sp.]